MLYRYIYTIVDQFCENGFLRAISYRSWSLRWEMRREVHFEQNISTIVCL